MDISFYLNSIINLNNINISFTSLPLIFFDYSFFLSIFHSPSFYLGAGIPEDYSIDSDWDFICYSKPTLPGEQDNLSISLGSSGTGGVSTRTPVGVAPITEIVETAVSTNQELVVYNPELVRVQLELQDMRTRYSQGIVDNLTNRLDQQERFALNSRSNSDISSSTSSNQNSFVDILGSLVSMVHQDCLNDSPFEDR